MSTFKGRAVYKLMFSLYSFLVISNFGFEDRIFVLVLIVQVPGHRLNLYFYDV